MLSVSSVVFLVTRTAQFVERQIGHDTLTAAAADTGVDDDLVDVAQHLFHSFQIETFAGDLGRGGVLRQNRSETAGFTGGFIDDAGAVAFSLFEKLCGFTPRAGEH